MESIKNQRVKLVIAGAAASALVVIGVVAAVAADQHETGTFAVSRLTMGATATATTPSAAPTDGAKANPGLKATRPKGF